MQDQLSNQTKNQQASQSILQLQRITYRTSVGDTRDGNQTYLESATDMEQHYQPLERLHDVGLHGWGIAAGLQVAFIPHQTGVMVRPGIALDSNGIHILLVPDGQADISSDAPGNQTPVPVSEKGASVPTDGLIGEQFLIMRFFEKVNFSTHFCTHTPWLHFVTLADLPTDGSSIILASVTFDSGPNAGQVLSVAQGTRQGADGHIERAYEFNMQRPAVLGGLIVSATLNSAGITVSTGLALNAIGQYIFLTSGGQAEIGPNADAPDATPTLVDVSDSGVSLPTTNFTGQKYLTIQHWQTPQAVILPTPSNTSQTAPVRFLYTPRLQLVDALNFTFDGSNVILAGITFGSGGVVTSLNADVRPGSALSTGSFHVLKSMTTSPSANSQSVLTGEAGSIVPMSNGLALTVSGAEDELHLNAASVQTSGDVVVNGSISVNGDVGMANAVVDGGLSVGDATVVHGDLTTGGTLNVSAAAHIQGDVTAGGALTVTGSTTANGPLTAKGNAAVAGTLTVAGATTTNTLTARGNILLTNTGSGSEAGMLRPTGNGLALSVPSASNEIHLENDNGGTIAKVSLATAKVAVRNSGGNESIVLDSEAGTVSSTNITTNTLTTTGSVITGSINAGNQIIVRNGAGGNGIVINPNGFPYIQVGGSGSGDSGSIAFYNNNRTSPTCSIDGTIGNMNLSGSLHVFGTKSFVQQHPTNATKQIVYVSLEGGEAGTYIRGTGTLIDGKAVVELPEHFGLVTHQEGLTVQLTPRGEWLQLYVVELSTSQVVVHEAQDKNGEFDYFVQGIRAGYEDHQVIQERVD